MLVRAPYEPLSYWRLSHTYPRERVRDLWLPNDYKRQRKAPLIPSAAPPVVVDVILEFDTFTLSPALEADLALEPALEATFTLRP